MWLPGYSCWSWKLQLVADGWVVLKIWQRLRATIYSKGCQGKDQHHAPALWHQILPEEGTAAAGSLPWCLQNSAPAMKDHL